MFKEWLWIHQYPPHVMLTSFHAERFINHNYPMFVLYVNNVAQISGMKALMEFKKAAETLQENKYLAMTVDLSIHKDISHRFAQNMEFVISHGIPRVVYYQPAHEHDYEHIIHYTMKDSPITEANIVKFMNDIKTHKLKRDNKYEDNYKLTSDVMVQDISYYNIKSRAFSILKKHYDLFILFYFSEDWKELHSKKALKEFNHAAEILGKRIEYIQSFKGSESQDCPVRLLRYDLSKNTRSG